MKTNILNNRKAALVMAAAFIVSSLPFTSAIAGDKATKLFKEKFEVVDMREQYLKFNDLNDYLQDIKSDAEEKIESSVKYKIRPGG